MYKTPGMTTCYHAVNADANGNNVMSNHITDGPATVTVSSGEYFETRGCADWHASRAFRLFRRASPVTRIVVRAAFPGREAQGPVEGPCGFCVALLGWR